MIAPGHEDLKFLRPDDLSVHKVRVFETVGVECPHYI